MRIPSQILSLFFIILFAVSSTAQAYQAIDVQQEYQTEKMDTVEIISKLKKGERAYLYFYDHFQDIRMPMEIKESMSVKIAFKDYLVLKDTEKQITFPILNSERVYISKNSDQITILKSESEDRSKELALLVQVIQKHQSFFTEASLNYQIIFNEIDSVASSNDVSVSYADEAKKVVYATYLNKIAGSFNDSKVNLPLNLHAIFQDESYLKYYDFRRALIAYSKMLALQSKSKTNDLKAILEITNLNFKGKIRDFLLFYHLNQSKQQDNYFKNQLDQFIKNSPSEHFIDYLTIKYLSEPVINNGELLDEQNNTVSYANLLKQYAGKVVYLDFWASWCMPCRAEIPYIKQLISTYQDKDLVVLSLSVDANKMHWKKAIVSEELTQGFKNYLVATNLESSLVRQFKIQSIPRYILIDKNGKVINSDAPRPSDTKIVKTLNDLLSK